MEKKLYRVGIVGLTGIAAKGVQETGERSIKGRPYIRRTECQIG